MLHSLALKNFRAFKAQSFEFARINIFAGANNSGKSSALSAINFIAQSISQRELNPSPIAINGSFEQLGTFLDIVHGNRSTTPMGFDLTYGYPTSDFHRINLEIRYRSQRRETEISKFRYFFQGKERYSYSVKDGTFDIKLNRKKIETIIPGIAKRAPRFAILFPVDHLLSRYSLVSEPEDEEVKKLDKATKALLRDLDRRMSRGRIALRNCFSNFDSISPFRDQPQRTYLFTGETPSRVGRTGSNGVSLLVNDASKRGRLKSGMAEKISEWLNHTGIASEIVLNTLTERHFEICVRDLNGAKHNICDVGFGCSQVLPVLVGALNIFDARNLHNERSTPTFVVQEPEIHLHPNAQADLGSFFLSAARGRGQLFIETHSDNLILRMAMHVAAGHLDPNDIAIFFCQNDRGKKSVRRISLTRQGVFAPKWPGGFFPQRERETLKLARARRGQGQTALIPPSDFLYFER
jgi:predicted ATPase